MFKGKNTAAPRDALPRARKSGSSPSSLTMRDPGSCSPRKSRSDFTAAPPDRNADGGNSGARRWVSEGLAELGKALKRSEQLGYDASLVDAEVLLHRPRGSRAWSASICSAGNGSASAACEEIAKPGDYMTFQLCDEPLVAVRGARWQAFVSCRMSADIAAPCWPTGRGNRQRLVCPYHHWSYDLEGRLAGRAAHGRRTQTFDKSACRLPEFAERRVAWLPVRQPGQRIPPPLAPRLQPLDRLIRNYHMEQMKLRYVADEVWHTNWKCLIENFMEGYHLSPLHRTTLHPVNPTKLCTPFRAGDAYFGYNAGYSPDLPRSQKGHPDLTDAEADNCVMFAVPPGLVSGCGGDYSSFICVQPETADRVRAKMGLIFYGDGWPQEAVEIRGQPVQCHHGRGQDCAGRSDARHGLEPSSSADRWRPPISKDRFWISTAISADGLPA